MSNQESENRIKGPTKTRRPKELSESESTSEKSALLNLKRDVSKKKTIVIEADQEGLSDAEIIERVRVW